ncbi:MULTISPECIES: hypothetical protein [Ensifer]|jgi:hypothetical protein|uniref:Auto-transporter adhesin head GIN domain-containing protein n=1 Tax=Ensifer canadensis TaxID=555315 RepID=A0AAW4FF86_9HYPH|nr:MULTISPECIES: hypothetical protein [Ensifer]MDP9628116.1 hypothetical protein [Ensifer adhaerens]KQU72258.1 hypothetical protein ASD00_15710 [Ensifer sp. Root31]KQW44446.1 hypothetical protein ASD02_14210 [Ensifer sp. Root1252]KQW84613.1 hypothetical protein ASD03_02395 [Ensifer sp. Root127]KQY71668.1 hypothetical protein ASD52_08415 [Ensifer sp. Root142]
MLIGPPAMVLAPILLLALASNAETSARDIDITGVTAIVATGDASAIELTSDETLPFSASVESRRSGWFAPFYSSWFYSDCVSETRMRVEGSTLYIVVAAPSWPELEECRTAFRANLKKGASISVEQPAFQAALEGEFSSVALKGKAADVSIEGHVGQVRLDVDALRARLIYEKTSQSETVEISGKALDIHLGFDAASFIDYRVMATASWVDSSRTAIPGARPLICIKGEMVRATIR